MSRSLALLVLSGYAACVSSAGATDLPPQEAPAFTATYKLLTRSREHAGQDWPPPVEDTVTVAVANKQSRWDHKGDGTTRIVDSVGRYTTTFGGKIPPKTAYRSRTPFVPIGWEFGYATVARATETAPERRGTMTIAGRPCTRLSYTSEQYGTPEFCVAENGVVLRFENASSTIQVTYEATSITEEAPAADRFAPPPGYTVEDRGQPRRSVPFLP